jgi:putative spermidine/putrescine transport system substrate-binding protein
MKVKIVAAGLATAMVLWAASASARDLTVVSFGGALQDALRKAFFAPYIQQTGKPIVEDTYDGSLSKISAQVKANAVMWDVVDVESNDVLQGCSEGYFEKLDWAKIGNRLDLIGQATNASPCGAAFLAGANILAYDGAKLANGPTTWADFWDVKKFPGKRGLRFSPKNTLEVALMADGVPPGKVYEVLSTPAGVDRAFKKLDELKPNIAWWKLGAESIQLLASGEVSMVSAYSGRVIAANRGENRQFKMAWDAGSIYFFDLWAIPKGAANEAQALQFIAFAVAPARQAELPKYIGYGPTSMTAYKSLDATLAADVPDPKRLAQGSAVVRNDEFWANYGDDLTRRFNVWAAQK